MKHFTKIITILFFFTILISCRKNVDKGTSISATGVAFDSSKNKLLSNTKVYLLGGRPTFTYNGVTYDRIIDSTITNNVGHFSINFIADGNYIDYALSLCSPVFPIYSNNHAVADYRYSNTKFNYKTQLTNTVVNGRELDSGIIHLKVNANPYDTLFVEVSPRNYFNELNQQFLLTGSSIDTQLNVYSLDSSMYDINFGVFAQKIQDSGFHRALYDSFFVQKNTKLAYTRLFNSTYELPLKK